MIYEITTIGNCVTDYFILADSKIIKTHKKRDGFINYLSYIYGDKVGVDEFADDLGGEACNAAVALRKIGIRSAVASMIGDDIYSRDMLTRLKKEKVGTKFLIKEKGKKIGISFVLLGPDRDRTILAYREENSFDKLNLKGVYTSSKSFYLAGINQYSRGIQGKLLRLLEKNSKPLYLNPSIYQIEATPAILSRLMKKTDLFCVNLEEAKKILKIRGDKEIKVILRKLKKMGPQIVVVTNSIKGSYAYDGEKYHRSGIYPAKRVDTTGAGDSFFATFVSAYKKGYDIGSCLKFASINSASVVSEYGAQRGLLSWNEIETRLKKNKVKVTKI